MNGILLFDKPILWTSHDAVDFVRRRVGQRAVGHAGTLDPLACGLLVMLLGRATKLSQAFSGYDKAYRGTMTLGLATDTQDLEGRIVSTGDFDAVREEDARRVFDELSGPQRQSPPFYSAVKKDGKKLVDWARRGVAIAADERPILVSEFRLLHFHTPEIHFFLACSKGTYVRSLCDMAGKKLGCGATLSSLVRERVGPFRLTDALGRDEVERLSRTEIEKRLVFE